MTRQCPHCADTGVVITNTWELGDPVFKSDCECAIGRSFSAPFIGPPQPTSAWLGEQAIDAHRADMTAQGRKECWHCDTWPIDDGTWSRVCSECRER